MGTMTTTTLVRPRSRTLVSRHVDGWLVGWFAVAIWVVLRLAEQNGTRVAPLNDALSWTGLTISALHFGLSYHLAYADPRGAMRQRPVALLIAPIVLAVTLATLTTIAVISGANSTRALTSWLVTSVFMLTMWHYVKQAYGIARLGATYAGISLAPREVRILRYGLYPLWAMSVVKLFTRGQRFSFARYRIGGQIFSPTVFSITRVIAFACAVPIVITWIGIARRSSKPPTALMVAPYVAGFLWLGMPVGYASVGALLGAFHAIQYLACASRAEVVTSVGNYGRVTASRWLEVVGGAACGGLLLTTWAPGTLQNLMVGATRNPLLFSAAFFVFLNLHHYLVDGVIWRTRGDLIRAMVA